MDSADPQNRSELRGGLSGRLVNQAQPSVEEHFRLYSFERKTSFKLDLMMMNS